MTMTAAERHTTEAEEAVRAAWLAKHEAGLAAEAVHRAANPTARDYALAIADELVALMAGELYLDDDGNFTAIPEEPDTDHECDEAVRYEDHECEQCITLGEALEAFEAIEPATLYDWLDTCLDVELYSRDGELHHVDVLVCFGGPTCWIMGKYGHVKYSWAYDTADVFVDGLSEALVDAFEGFEGCF